MSKKKQAELLSVADLNKKIDRIVEIRPMANEYSLLVKEVKQDLLARGDKAWATEAGNTASVKRRPAFEWLVDNLKRALPRGVFEALCPRKADARKLNQRLAATPEDKALAACKIELTGKPELEVLAKGESPAQIVRMDEADEEAA